MTAVSARVRFGARPSSAVPRYTRGDTVEVWCDFRDAAGALVDVSGVSVTVWWPGGTVMSPAVTPVEETAGTWRADVPTPLYPGLWRIEFACTVPADAVASAAFSVVAADASEAVAPVPSPVTSVAGRAGAVTLAPSDIAVATTVGAGATLFNVLHDLPGKAVAEYSPSWDPEGVQPMHVLLNDCMQEYIQQGNPVSVGAGLYLLGDSLIARSNLRFIASLDAQFTAPIGAVGGAAVNIWRIPSAAAAVDPATRERDILIQGGVWGKPGTLITDEYGTGMISPYRGDIFGLTADRMRIIDTRVIGYPHGRAYALQGTDVRLIRPYARHPTRLRDYPGEPRAGWITSAAIRIGWCDNLWIYDVDVHSADDGVQFGTSQSGVFSNAGRVINSGVIGGSVLSDSNSGLHVQPAGTNPEVLVDEITYAHLIVRAAGTIIRVRNNSAARVGTVRFIGIVADESGFMDNPVAILIQGAESAPGYGGIGLVEIDHLTLKRYVSQACRFEGAVGTVRMSNFAIGAPLVPTTLPIIAAYGPRELVLRDGSMIAGDGDGIVVGGRTRAITETWYPEDGDGPATIAYTRRGRTDTAKIDTVAVTGLQPGRYAANIQNSEIGSIRRLRAEAAATGGAANAVLLSRGASNYEVDETDVRGIAGTAVLDQGVLNTVGRIIGASAVTGAVQVVGRRRLSLDVSVGRAHTPSTARALGYDANGDFVLVNPNSARWSPSLGLLIAPGRTFSNTDPMGAGGNPGILGSDGAAPSGWAFGNNYAGLSVTRLVNEPFGEFQVPVFRIQGTATSGAQMFFDYMSAATAGEGEQWAGRIYAALLAGTADGILTMQGYIRTSAGAAAASVDLLGSLGEELQPTSLAATNPVGSTSMRGRVRLTFAIGVPVDVTLAFTGFLEKGPAATLPAVPGVGLTGSVTRGREIVTYLLPSAERQRGYASGTMLLSREPTGSDAGLLVLDAGADSDRIALVIPDGTTDLRLQSIVGSAVELSNTHGAMVPDATLRFALAWDIVSGVLRLAVNGVDDVLTLTGTVPAAITQMGIGRGSNTGADTATCEVIGLSVGAGEIADNALLALVAG